MSKFFSSIFLLSLCLLIFSCKKAEVDNETQTAMDFTISQRICAEIFPYVENILYADTNLANGAFFTDSISANTVQSCVSITNVSNTANYPFSFTLDFGSGCTDSTLNVYFKGKLNVIINNHWDSANSQMTITANGFYIDNYAVNFNMLIVNKGDNNYSVSINNGKITDDNSSFTYLADLSYTQSAGLLTFGNISDDSWTITGAGTGISRENKKYSFKIIQPIIKNMNCKYPEKGVIDISPENFVVRTVDYGKGSCDETANVIINGNNFEINLK